MYGKNDAMGIRLSAVQTDTATRGFELRRMILGHLNGFISKDELRTRFLDWERAQGTKFIIRDAPALAAQGDDAQEERK